MFDNAQAQRSARSFETSEYLGDAMSKGQRTLHGGSICFVAHDLAYLVNNGGIGTYFWLMATTLASAGWDVLLLYCGPLENPSAVPWLRSELTRHGIRILFVDDLVGEPSIPQYGDGTWGLRQSHRVMTALRVLESQGHRFDLIEFGDWQAIGFRSVQAKRRGIAFQSSALIVKLHGPSRWERQGNGHFITRLDDHKLDYCERYAFDYCDIQMSPTKYISEWAAKQGWAVRPDGIVSYPFPMVEVKPCPALPLTGLVFFGRLELRKGLDLFLDAVNRLDDQNIEIAFLGRDTVLPSGYLASTVIADRLGRRPYELHLDFHRRDALRYLCQGGRLAVLPSRRETFGFTVAECVAHEIPFIACAAGGNVDVLGPTGRAAWLVEPTVDDIVRGIRQALGADLHSASLVRSTAKTECDHSRRTREVVGAYGDALQRVRQHRIRRRQTLRETPRPTVTVAVTHHNLGRELDRLLPTLANQTYQSIETIVVDDGSDDPVSRDIFSDLKKQWSGIRFVEQANTGPGAARNRLLAECVGNIFIPVDADNLASDTMVECFVESMERDDRPDILSCFMLAFESDDDIAKGDFSFQYVPTGGPLIVGCAENVFGDTNSAFRTEALRAIGGFDTDRTTPWEDWDTFIRLVAAGASIDVIPHPLFYYRVRSTARSRLIRDPARYLFPYQQRLLEHLSCQHISQDQVSALWETTLSFRLLEERYRAGGQPPTVPSSIHGGVERMVSKPLGYRLADRADLVARRHPRAKKALRSLLIRLSGERTE